MQFSQKICLVAFLLSFTITSVTNFAFFSFFPFSGLFTILMEVITIGVPFIVFYQLGKNPDFFSLSKVTIIFLLLSTAGGYFAGSVIQLNTLEILFSTFMPSFFFYIPLLFPYLFIFFVQFSALELAARKRRGESK